MKVVAQYPLLTEAEIKDMVIHHKWTPVLQNALNSEQEKLSQNLTQRIKELADRYQQALLALETITAEASQKYCITCKNGICMVKENKMVQTEIGFYLKIGKLLI